MNIWAYTVVVAFFVFHLLQQYRLWTQQPQLNSYLFPMFASVTLMLTAYYRACKDLGLSVRRRYFALSQTALFFCVLAIGGSSWVFYSTMAAWLLLDTLPGKE